MSDDALQKALMEVAAQPEGAEQFTKMLARYIQERGDSVSETRTPAHREQLLELYATYSDDVQHTFEPGVLVRWKPGMKNRRVPAYGQPAVVVRLLDPPILSTEDSSGSAYFREPLTVALGISDEDDEFIVYHFDGARFEPLPTD